MDVSITPELEQFVHSQISTGMYESTSELFNEALVLLAQRNEARRKRLEKFTQEIQIGLDDIAKGDVISAEESKRRMAEFKQQFLSKKLKND